MFNIDVFILRSDSMFCEAADCVNSYNYACTLITSVEVHYGAAL